MEYDIDVHRLICSATGNPHLEETLVRLDNLATRIWCLVLDRLPTIGDHVQEHVSLLRAMPTAFPTEPPSWPWPTRGISRSRFARCCDRHR